MLALAHASHIGKGESFLWKMYKVASFHYLAGHLDIDPIEDKHMDTYNYIPTVVQI